MLVYGRPWHQREHGRRSGSGWRSRPCGESWHEHLRGRSPVADRGMRADPIVVTAPALDDDLCFALGVEELAIEQFVAQACVEALDKAVFPRAAGSDVGGLRSDRTDPLLHGFGDELRPLSERMCSGTPRRMNRSDSTSM